LGSDRIQRMLLYLYFIELINMKNNYNIQKYVCKNLSINTNKNIQNHRKSILIFFCI